MHGVAWCCRVLLTPFLNIAQLFCLNSFNGTQVMERVGATRVKSWKPCRMGMNLGLSFHIKWLVLIHPIWRRWRSRVSTLTLSMSFGFRRPCKSQLTSSTVSQSRSLSHSHPRPNCFWTDAEQSCRLPGCSPATQTSL